jgi:hypothetical protein
METIQRLTVQRVAQVGKGAGLFLFGSLAIHTLTMFVDHFMIKVPINLDLHGHFLTSAFSVPMLPIMAAYGMLILLVYFFWDKKQKAVHLLQQKKLQKEKVDFVLKSMQRITGILAEHIAARNAEVINWLDRRRRRGQIPSEKVERPAREIASALHPLSELTFVYPYTETRPKSIEEIERVLQSRLKNGAVIR